MCESKLYSFDLLINELCIYSKPNHMNEKYKPLLQILHVNSLCIRQLKSKYFPKWQKWCSKRFFKYIIHRSMKVHLTYNIKIIFSAIKYFLKNKSYKILQITYRRMAYSRHCNMFCIEAIAFFLNL